MINSTLTDLSATNPSNIKYYKVECGWQYELGNTYVTQSGGLTAITCSVGGTMFKAYDGYAVFPDPINDSLISQSAYWPFMTDMGSVTQSIQSTDKSNLGLGVRGASIWVGANDTKFPTLIAVTSSYSNNTTIVSGSNISSLTGSTTSSAQVYQFGAAPGDNTGLIPLTNGAATLTKYKIQAYSGSVVLSTLNYVIQDECYYIPVRVAFKTRFGQLDFFNFYKRHDNQFNTEQRLYQPQLGYNELFKQLLVSDEIYWMYDQNNNLVKPLTIRTNNLLFKTGVNNKLIQYAITFDIGQPYKLLL